MSIKNLTAEQISIVNHAEGAGLVFAVAGSGKTTCMVHRIKNLIEKKICAPSRILATSFNRAAANEIQLRLAGLGVEGKIFSSTLHGLGFRIIKYAQREKFISPQWKIENDPEGINQRILNRVLTQYSIDEGINAADLGVDKEELRNQISVWKSNLIYPDASFVDVPEAAVPLTNTAQHTNMFFVEFYRKFENFRRESRLLTFDDMLMFSWELLQKYPDLLNNFRSQFEMIMVDEFQDVNYAQYQMLDLLQQPHRNYMAIGDDDQCIYEWRGANPNFILDFADKYAAKTYTISDNFRSSLSQIYLANKTIQQNKKRHQKKLNVTNEGYGDTILVRKKTNYDAAADIVEKISQSLAAGKSSGEMVILIRLYSQTAFFEILFYERGIPYQVVGGQPFYKRREVITLMQYLSFAKMEQQVQREGLPDDPQQVEKYCQLFKEIINRPRRYLSNAIIEEMIQIVRREGKPFTAVLSYKRTGFKKKVSENIEAFSQQIQQLITKLRIRAGRALKWLVDEINYKQYLIEMSGIYEVGVTRVQTVKALIEFSKKRGNCHEFLDYLREISVQKKEHSGMPPIKMMTIYRAKGLEWDTVFLPGCNEGIMPCATADVAENQEAFVQNIEAERRLFYVAVTRAKSKLWLYSSEDGQISQFIESALFKKLEQYRGQHAGWLENGFQAKNKKSILTILETLNDLNLGRYLKIWHKSRSDFSETFIENFFKLCSEMNHAQERQKQHKQAWNTYRAQIKTSPSAARTEASEFTPVVKLRKYKSAFYPVQIGDRLYTEEFDDQDIMILSGRGLLGVLLMEDHLKAFNWKSVELEVISLPDSENVFSAKIVKMEVIPQKTLGAAAEIVPPEDLDPRTLRLTQNGLQEISEIIAQLISKAD